MTPESLTFEAKKSVTMPTLVWRRWPESSMTTRREAQLHIAANAAFEAIERVNAERATSKRHSDGGRNRIPTERKRKLADPANGTTKKKSKATIERKLPQGVYKSSSGKFQCMISWRGKNRCIGSFDTPEQASAAYVSVRKNLNNANLSALGADEVDAAFDAAKKKAVEAVGGLIRDLPTGVTKLSSGTFQSMTQWDGKTRTIGTFNTPEQASTAYLSVKKDIMNAKLSGLGADEVDAALDAAIKKAVEAVGGVTKKRDLPRGVRKTSSGKFIALTRLGGKDRHIGAFDTSKQASAAYVSVKKDLAGVKLSTLGVDEVDAAFDATKKKALESFGGVVPEKRDLPRGVTMTSSGKFKSAIGWRGKNRYIGSFDTPEQASAAYLSAKKDLEDGKLSALGADEVDTAFDAAKKKAQESCGGFVSEKRDLPRGVREISPGKFISVIWWYGKDRYIGTFDTPELASAAYVSVKKDMKNAKLSTLSANEVNALFDAAQKKAVEAVGVLV